MPARDVIPTAEVAIQIARAVLTPIYGDETIRNEEPLTAELHGDEWEVSGTLPAGRSGGIAEISIKKADGRIVRIFHGR
jgi:hypothetical protein